MKAARVPLSSAAGHAALGAGRPDHRRLALGVFRARGDAQLRPSEDRHSAGAHGRRNADSLPDGHSLHRPNVDIETGRCDDRSSRPGSDRADRALRLLRPGPPDGRDRLYDGDSRRAPRDRVRWLRRPATAHLSDLSDPGGARLYCDAACLLHHFARAGRALPPIRQKGRDCSGGCFSGDVCQIPRLRRNGWFSSHAAQAALPPLGRRAPVARNLCSFAPARQSALALARANRRCEIKRIAWTGRRGAAGAPSTPPSSPSSSGGTRRSRRG